MLRKNPGFAATAILTLALGIGANTAIFSVVRAVLLSSLPYQQPDRLVKIWGRLTAEGLPKNSFSDPEYFELPTPIQSFDQVAAYYPNGSANLGSDDAAAATSHSWHRQLDVVSVVGRPTNSGTHFFAGRGSTGTQMSR